MGKYQTNFKRLRHGWIISFIFLTNSQINAFSLKSQTFGTKYFGISSIIETNNRYPYHSLLSSTSSNDDISNTDKEKGNNWIEKSSPTGIPMTSSNDDDSGNYFETADYTLGIDGNSFSTGSLSSQIYDALISVASKRFPSETIPEELENIYKLYAMDLTAKEATQLALNQNGLQFDIINQNLKDDTEEDIWGELENIKINGVSYDTTDEAVQLGLWNPGQTFSFVARNVRAKEKELEIKDLLASIDPDGSIRKELDSRPEKSEYAYDPVEQIKSLKDLADDNERRCNAATRDVTVNGIGYDQTTGRGYDVISLDDIKINDDDSTAAIMEALESHTYLVVDLGEPSDTSTSHPTNTLHAMWQSIEAFFSVPNRAEIAPSMEVAPDAGSRHAVFGYATYENDAMQFLETRMIRSSDTNDILPSQIKDMINEKGVQNLTQAFHVLSKIGKDIVTIATAAATQEANAYTPNYNDDDAVDAAILMTNDLVDDGTSQPNTKDMDTTVSMSPHRMCRYSSKSTSSTNDGKKGEEIFGAHTDTSFVTIIPVAAVSGLEVFDDDSNQWIRPEKIAREHWEKQNKDTSKDTLPWHCRYVVIMSGEFLQLVTRGMIPCAVHRVIAVTGGEPRLSAPVLLRARSKMVMDIEKYFGETESSENNNLDMDDIVGKELLVDCNKMTMEEIHDALQP